MDCCKMKLTVTFFMLLLGGGLGLSCCVSVAEAAFDIRLITLGNQQGQIRPCG